MTGMGKNIGSIIDWASGSEGQNTIERLTKNPALENFNLDAQSNYATTRNASQAGLEDYIKQYLAGSKTASTRSGQEQNVIDRYYNGDIERRLSELRTRRAQASKDAAARGFAYALRGQNADRIAGGGGGTSSYDRALAMKTGADLDLQARLDNLGQERGDMDYLNRSQLGLMGQRSAMADALAARALVPGQARQADLGWNMNAIRGLLGNDAANNMYGVKYEPSAGEKFSQWQQNDANDIAQIAGMASSVYGGGGGGGAPQAPPPPAGGTTWGQTPMNYGAPAMNWQLPTNYTVNPYTYGGATNSGSGSFALPPFGETYKAYVPNGWGY